MISDGKWFLFNDTRVNKELFAGYNEAFKYQYFYIDNLTMDEIVETIVQYKNYIDTNLSSLKALIAD